MMGSQDLGSVVLASEPDRGNGGGLPPAGSPLLYLLDKWLSFGHGLPGTDDVLPEDDETAEAFWFSPSTDADHATPGQVREWCVEVPLDLLSICVVIDLASLDDDGGQIIVTVDGVETACFVTLPPGPIANERLEMSVAVAVAATSKIGVKWAPGDDCTGGTLRCEVRLRGRWSGETPPPPPILEGALWIRADLGIQHDGAPAEDGETVTLAEDQDPLEQDLAPLSDDPPLFVADLVDGLPAIDFGVPGETINTLLGLPDTNLKRSSVDDFASGDARTIYVVMTPKDWTHGGSSGHGGGVMGFRKTNDADSVMWLAAMNYTNSLLFYNYNNGNGLEPTVPEIADFNNTRLIMKWVYDGTDFHVYKNTGSGFVEIAMPDNTANPADESAAAGFALGGQQVDSGYTGQMYLHEARVFSGVLSLQDQQTYEAEIEARWGIA